MAHLAQARLGTRLFIAALLSASTLLMGSCTVPIDGVAGVTVDGNGDLLGVISTCSHQIDGATLYTHNRRDDEVELGWWDLHGDSTKELLTWSLAGQNSGDATSDTQPELRPEQEMTLYGWTEDNSHSAAHVTFRVADTEALRPGLILSIDVDSSGTDDEHNATFTPREFKLLACEFAD